MRAQVYMLVIVSALFLLYGVIGGIVVMVMQSDNRLFVFTLPFLVVGILGLPMSSALAGVSARIERLERLQAERTGDGR